jgi:hypothetical protein
MKFLINTFMLLFLVTIFSACASNQRGEQFLQSNSATIISKDFGALSVLLIKYKKILDLRNPKLSDKTKANQIIFDIEHHNNILTNSPYKEYLTKAFDAKAKYKSDYLILGLYKMFYKVYNIKEGHHITALGYDAKAFKTMYYTLKVLRWKTRNAKDKEGRFLFATWQLNWQLEFNKNYHNISIDNLKSLPSIKSGREGIMNHSNFNFEIIITSMINRVKNSLEAMGEEPLNLSVTAMKAIILL